VSPARCMWASLVILGAVLGYMMTRCDPKPTQAQAAEMVLVGVCEARVLVIIEKSETRTIFCGALRDVQPSDVCAQYMKDIHERNCP